MPVKVLPIIAQNGTVNAPPDPMGGGGGGEWMGNIVESVTPYFCVSGPESHAELEPKFWAEINKVCLAVPTTAEVEAAIQAVKAEAAAASEALKNDLGAKLNSLSSNVVLQTLKDEILTDLKSYIDLKFTQIEAQLKAGVAIKEET